MKRQLVNVALAGLLLAILLLATMIAPDGTRSRGAEPQVMTAANALVDAGHFSEAITMYESQVTQGIRDSALFYNLGNAYFRQGELEAALLNYQRAAQLDPRDADIRHNLALAEEQAATMGRSPVELSTSPVIASLQMAGQWNRQWLTLDELALLALAAWFLLGLLVFARRIFGNNQTPANWRLGFLSRSVPAAITMALALVLVVSTLLGSRVLLEQNRAMKVISVPQVALGIDLSQGPGS